MSDTPDYRNPEKLRSAYETEGTIKGTANRFDASCATVRNWLIEYGIHTPDPTGPSLAHRLEASDADDVGPAEGKA